MVRIEIRDFQAIDRVSLEIDGFTTLVGRSNIGKSAVVRAISGAISNEQGTKFVRHGPDCLKRTKGAKTCKCFSSVRIQAPGLDLLWEKGEAIGRYVVNGTVYEALGKGFPEFLKQWFAPVTIGNNSSMLQISEQFDPIFLLGESGSVVADVLSDVTQLNNINVAMRLVEKDRREVSSVLKVREKDARNIQDRLASYVGLEAVSDRFPEIESRLLSLESLEGRVQRVESFLVRVTSVVATIRQLMQAEAIEVSKIDDLSDVSKLSVNLSGLCDRWVEKTDAVTLLEGCERIGDIKEIESADRFWNLCTLQDRFESQVRLIRSLESVESIKEPVMPNLGTSFGRIRRLQVWANRLESFRDVLADLACLDGLYIPDGSGLVVDTRKTDLAVRYGNLSGDVARLEESLIAADCELVQVVRDLSEIDTCPLCGRKLNTDADICISDGRTPCGSSACIVEGGLS